MARKSDAFPRTIAPMLATLSPMPADQDAYGFEFKWDGYRALIFWDGAALSVKSRNGLELFPRFPELSGLAKALKKPTILDGEVVALNEKGVPDFGLLQKRAAHFKSRVPVVFMAFDVLYRDGRLAAPRPYTERRELLESLKLDSPSWQTPPWRRGVGDAMFEVSRKHGFEGVVAKRLESEYLPGRRSPAWLKIRLFKRQELVIGGWTPGEGALSRSLGSLLLGYYEPGAGFRYAGHVGTGFTVRQRLEMKKTLEKMRLAKSPFTNRVDRKDAVFAQPRLVAEVQFTEWTAGRRLRHPSFVAFRIDKNPSDVVFEPQ